MEFFSPSSEEFSSSLLEEKLLSKSSRMTGVFFLENALFSFLYLRYFALWWALMLDVLLFNLSMTINSLQPLFQAPSSVSVALLLLLSLPPDSESWVMDFSSPSSEEFSSSLLEEESLSESSRTAGVFSLENALFSFLYLRYFAFWWEACFSKRLTSLDFSWCPS